jgi:hypothetical protein
LYKEAVSEWNSLFCISQKAKNPIAFFINCSATAQLLISVKYNTRNLNPINSFTMKSPIALLLLTVVSVLFFSCEGPRGSDGYDGLNGRDGQDGQDGKDGRDGVTNVRSAIYDVAPNTWQGNENGYTTSLNAPEIDQDIYLYGAVLVYELRNEGKTNQSFNQLPYTWISGTMTEYMDFDVYTGKIDITMRWTDNGVNTTEAPNGTFSFKIILIKGMPLSALKLKTDISNPSTVLEFMKDRAIVFDTKEIRITK